MSRKSFVPSKLNDTYAVRYQKESARCWRSLWYRMYALDMVPKRRKPNMEREMIMLQADSAFIWQLQAQNRGIL